MDSHLATPATTAKKADGHLLEAIEGFLLSRRVGNCTERTLGTYQDNLRRFAHSEGTSLGCSTLVLQKYLTSLQAHLKPITAHQHFRVLRTFFAWCAETGLRSEDPMRGITMRVPKTLPRVPEDEDLRRSLAACPEPSRVGVTRLSPPCSQMAASVSAKRSGYASKT
jgi:site-specific recombinase XerD